MTISCPMVCAINLSISHWKPAGVVAKFPHWNPGGVVQYFWYLWKFRLFFWTSNFFQLCKIHCPPESCPSYDHLSPHIFPQPQLGRAVVQKVHFSRYFWQNRAIPSTSPPSCGSTTPLTFQWINIFLSPQTCRTYCPQVHRAQLEKVHYSWLPVWPTAR